MYIESSSKHIYLTVPYNIDNTRTFTIAFAGFVFALLFLVDDANPGRGRAFSG
jgi:hypothetical protein